MKVAESHRTVHTCTEIQAHTRAYAKVIKTAQSQGRFPAFDAIQCTIVT